MEWELVQNFIESFRFWSDTDIAITTTRKKNEAERVDGSSMKSTSEHLPTKRTHNLLQFVISNNLIKFCLGDDCKD